MGHWQGKGVLTVSSEYSSSEVHCSCSKNSCTFEEQLRAPILLEGKFSEWSMRAGQMDQVNTNQSHFAHNISDSNYAAESSC